MGDGCSSGSFHASFPAEHQQVGRSPFGLVSTRSHSKKLQPVGGAAVGLVSKSGALRAGELQAAELEIGIPVVVSADLSSVDPKVEAQRVTKPAMKTRGSV